MNRCGMGSARAGRRWLTGLLALVGLAWMWAAQAAGADAAGGPARSVVDDRGQALALPARVVRLVSLSPTLTESVCVLGACDRLVGVDRFSNWPESVTKLPRLGSLGSFNVEAVAALRPDLVLLASDGPLVKQLARLGVPVLVLSPQRHADVADTLARLARALGLPPARAQQVWDDIRRELHDLAESLPARDRGLRTWVEIDPAPWLAGPDSFLGETLTLLGLANCFSQQLSSLLLRRSCAVKSDAVSQDDDSGILPPIFSSTCSFVMGEITMSITVLKRSFLLSKWNGLPILARATHSLARDRAPSAPGAKTMPETRPMRSPPSSAPTGPRV